ncbi:hypothetical protein KIW84_046122 [Lathyrus oleraceus]|uniref:Uncharacterized protein n=1 Tax=Pisum sativum TaxID=3888 RepID=A0A9D4XQ30_PEA|nr:hypothetical protein KIW84_046122 [Pisum sativum]
MTLQHRAEATKTQSQWGGPVSHAATAAQVAAPAADQFVGKPYGRPQTCKKHTKPEQIAILSHIEHGGFALLEVIGSKGEVKVNGKIYEKERRFILSGGDEVTFVFFLAERLKFQQLHNNISTANVPSPMSMLETQGMTESASKNRRCVEIMSLFESRNEKEVRADFDTMNTLPVLKTPSPMKRQASELYTRRTFMRFQEDLDRHANIHGIQSQGRIRGSAASRIADMFGNLAASHHMIYTAIIPEANLSEQQRLWQYQQQHMASHNSNGDQNSTNARQQNSVNNASSPYGAISTTATVISSMSAEQN